MRPPSEVRAELEAIDATLAGAPVDPAHAELAELSLLLAGERPGLDAAGAARLDSRVHEAMAATPAPRERSLRWRLAAGALAAVAAGVGAVVLAFGGGGARPTAESLGSATSGASTSAAGAAQSAPSLPSLPSARAPAPGRAVIQSAQLTLAAGPTRIETVASEVFAAVGAAGGYVTGSTVTQTGGPDGSAQLQISLPSASLGQTLATLSRLPDGRVVSRSDATQDVTDALGTLRRRLADARAQRVALLHALAGATTPGQLASLRAQLRDAERAIDGDVGAVRRMERRVAFSTVSVAIQANAPPAPVAHHRSPVERAVHALGVIGGALLAALVLALPLVAVLAALAWAALRGRRAWRERGL